MNCVSRSIISTYNCYFKDNNKITLRILFIPKVINKYGRNIHLLNYVLCNAISLFVLKRRITVEPKPHLFKKRTTRRRQ